MVEQIRYNSVRDIAFNWFRDSPFWYIL